MTLVTGRAIRRLIPLLVWSIVATACGSTARAPSSRAVAGGTSPGAQPGDLSIPVGGHGGAGVGGIPGTSGAVSPGGGHRGFPRPGNGRRGMNPNAKRTGPGPPRPISNAPGITAAKIYLGAAYVKNQGAANQALGAGGLNEGDRRKMYDVMIRRVNSEGGLAGREVVPVYYGFDAQSSQTADQQNQAACTKWTEDHQVFAILISGQIFDACAAKEGAVEVDSFHLGAASVPEDYRKYPGRIDVNTLNLVRMGFVTVDGLFRHGYFDRGAKVGIVTWDASNYREAISQGYIPALRRHGLSLATDPYYISVPQTAQDMGTTSSDVSNAVLKFNAQGIDHVMVLDGPAGACGGFCLTLEWVQNAQSQHYYPRYGFNTENSPDVGYREGLIPRDQLHRMVAVVWRDTEKDQDQGWHENPRRQLCLAIMQKHGIDMSNPNAQSAALEACDSFWFLQAVMSRVRGPLGASSFVEAVDRLGYGYAGPIAYTNAFSANRHDGVGAARIMRYVDHCDCFEYVTKPYRV